MIGANALGLCGIVALFLAMYVLVPGAAARGRGRWIAGFLRASLFVQASTMALGLCRLALPGAVLPAYAGWAALSALWERREHWRGPRRAWLGILERAERGRPAISFSQPGLGVRPGHVAVALLALGVLVQRADFGLHNCRFARPESYARVSALQGLADGAAGGLDPSVFLLLDLHYWTGMDAAAVVRAAGPVFAAALAVAAAFCAYRLGGGIGAAFLACGFVGVLPVLARDPAPGECGGAEIAAVYWLFGIAERRLRAYAFATALLVHPAPSWVLLEALGAVLAAILVSRVAARARAFAGAAFSCVFAVGLLGVPRPQAPEGPLQYEGAARTCVRVAAALPAKRWLIVSPPEEAAFTRGRGWHVELVDFVSQLSPAQVARPEFVFPYPAREIFVFVEKVPLNSAGALRRSPLSEPDDAVRGYYTPLGRTATEFQAAALIAAYSRSHKDVSVYYDDDRVTVYRIVRPPSAG